MGDNCREQGDVDVVKDLLRVGADVNAQEERSEWGFGACAPGFVSFPGDVKRSVPTGPLVAEMDTNVCGTSHTRI